MTDEQPEEADPGEPVVAASVEDDGDVVLRCGEGSGMRWIRLTRDEAAKAGDVLAAVVAVHPRLPSLTTRQRDALEAITASMADRGYPPSVRELAHAIGVTSTSTVAHVLRTLEHKGYIRTGHSRARAITVVHPAR